MYSHRKSAKLLKIRSTFGSLGLGDHVDRTLPAAGVFTTRTQDATGSASVDEAVAVVGAQALGAGGLHHPAQVVVLKRRLSQISL